MRIANQVWIKRLLFIIFPGRMMDKITKFIIDFIGLNSKNDPIAFSKESPPGIYYRLRLQIKLFLLKAKIKRFFKWPLIFIFYLSALAAGLYFPWLYSQFVDHHQMIHNLQAQVCSLQNYESPDCKQIQGLQ